MSNLNVTYHEIITHAHVLGINFIPWDHCKRGPRLGAGASMNVFSGTYEDNGVIHNAAFKFVNASLTEKTRESRRSNILRDVRQEIRIMGRLKEHSRIVQLLAVSFNDHTPILILELAKSNLEDYLQNEHVEWKTKLGFMYDIAFGLEAIHKIEVVHGDMKASNILIYASDNDNMIAKISDFGFSSTNLSVRAGSTPGYTIRFCPLECFDPELSDWNGKHTVDIYSYGLVVYQIADNGTLPFNDFDENELDIMKKEGSELAVLMEDLPDDTPTEIRMIIRATVKNVPSERLGLEEVKNVLKGCKEWNQIYSYEEAKSTFESLTRAGPPESIDAFGMNYLPISSSLKTSIFREYQRLADTGDMTALYNLGLCWFYGFGTERDYSKAVKYYKISADAGTSGAQISLGLCYQYGRGVTKDYIKAVELYTKAAETGNIHAYTFLGSCYQNGFKDSIKAAEWYTKGAEADNPFSQNNLGMCYQHGIGVTKDYIKAIELYTKGAEAGNASAQYNLGMCYQFGVGVTKDIIKAIQLYTKAAEAGNGDAQSNLGFCYQCGLGVTKDSIKAIELFTKAAEAGNAGAQSNLGMCYQHGQGVTKDYIKAVELYTKAAEAGNVPAMYNLGWCYEKGVGATKDYIKAVELYTEAAEAGHVGAQGNLGWCYQNGVGVTKDYVKAVELYTKAAESGDATAIYNLAWCFENGQGVTKDYIKAIELYTKAAEAGDIDAPKDIERLKNLDCGESKKTWWIWRWAS